MRCSHGMCDRVSPEAPQLSTIANDKPSWEHLYIYFHIHVTCTPFFPLLLLSEYLFHLPGVSLTELHDELFKEDASQAEA